MGQNDVTLFKRLSESSEVWATNILGTICRVSPYALAIVISGWQLVFGLKSHFIPENNDVLGLLALADGLHIASPASLYNYFYPFLYPLLIHFLPVGDRVAWLGAGSWLLNTVSLLLVAKICYRLTKASTAAVIAVLTLAFGLHRSFTSRLRGRIRWPLHYFFPQ